MSLSPSSKYAKTEDYIPDYSDPFTEVTRVKTLNGSIMIKFNELNELSLGREVVDKLYQITENGARMVYFLFSSTKEGDNYPPHTMMFENGFAYYTRIEPRLVSKKAYKVVEEALEKQKEQIVSQRKRPALRNLEIETNIIKGGICGTSKLVKRRKE
jgi:hypothetical protein